MPLASSMEPPTIPLAAARRIVWAQPSGVSLKPFSKSAATGKVVALAIMPALASVSSRDNAPSASGRPRLKAQPALVVATTAGAREAGIKAGALVGVGAPVLGGKGGGKGSIRQLFHIFFGVIGIGGNVPGKGGQLPRHPADFAVKRSCELDMENTEVQKMLEGMSETV